MDADAYRDFAEELARASGEVVRGMFRSADLAVDVKDDASPVTAADREAERRLREMIEERFPEHGIVGEEFGSEREDAEHVWVLDPIDGTIPFVAGVPLFGTLIGLLHEGKPALGLIHQPISGELVIGTASGTTFNGRPSRLRPAPALEEAMLLTTDPNLIDEHKEARFDELRRRTDGCRGWGDCYGYLLVATGRADIMVDPILHPWDILPLIPVIRGAGGVITTWEGEDPVTGSSAVACAPELHERVLAILAGAS